MKSTILTIFICLVVGAGFAQDGKTNAPAASKDAGSVALPVSAAKVNAPFVLTNGYLFQPNDRTEVGEGGKAVFAFTITNAGEYVIHAEVSAPGEESNSFFLNIDAQPQDPLCIWDVGETKGFEDRVVSWRGDGGADADQFSPKVFKLAEGDHQLFLQGREPDTQLKSLSLRPAKVAAPPGGK